MSTTDLPHHELVAISKDSIAEFVQDLTADVRHYDGRDRRNEKRYAVSVPVMMTPFDDSGFGTGNPRPGVTHEISRSAISIYFTGPIDEDYMLLQFERQGHKEFRIIVRVIRRRRIGPFWEIVGKFAYDRAA